MIASLRQWRYPRAFRIYPTDWTKALHVVAGDPGLPPAEIDPVRSVDPPQATDVQDCFTVASCTIVELSTGLWRLRQRMIDPQSGEPLPEHRRAFRHLASVWDALEGMGVDVIDHHGQPYDPGQALVVLAFQPTADIAADVVLETIRPSVYLADRRLQVGEVIVGTPTK